MHVAESWVMKHARYMGNQATPRALVLIRVPRGAPAPGPDDIQRALAEDRRRMPPGGASGFDHAMAGPYAILVDGVALDEYVIWEA